MYFLWSGHKLCIFLRCCHALLAAVGAMHLGYIVTCQRNALCGTITLQLKAAAAVANTYIYLDKVRQKRNNALGIYFRLYLCPSQYIGIRLGAPRAKSKKWFHQTKPATFFFILMENELQNITAFGAKIRKFVFSFYIQPHTLLIIPFLAYRYLARAVRPRAIYLYTRKDINTA